MYSTVYAGALKGIYAYLVQVEVDIAQGLPMVELVGYLSSEVKESKERVRVALKNTGIKMPPMRITINLSPGDIRKEGTGFDVPIAIGMLEAMEYLDKSMVENTLFIGELGLDGEIKRVKGILPIVQAAARQGVKRCIVPVENAAEGAVITGIKIVGVSNMKDLIAYLMTPEDKKDTMISPTKMEKKKLFKNSSYEAEPDFRDIHGQEGVKRGAEIAAAGFHHVLMIGPPGTGKSLIGKSIPHILPTLSMQESMEVSTIYSVQGLLDASNALITKRPFVNPHHTSSAQALIGGGRIPKPGAVSLAHKGVLFLDELPEFPRNILDMLRQPLEEKKVIVSRIYGNYSFPSDFMLVSSMNPCPCGYYPDLNKCRCSEQEVKRYLSHVSGPILDRIDICVEAQTIDFSKLKQEEVEESSERVRMRVMEARERQEHRFKDSTYRFNSEIITRDIKKYCSLGLEEERLLEQVFKTMSLSVRGYYRILRVARTIADLAGSEKIERIHLSEAICYRRVDTKYWKGQGY